MSAISVMVRDSVDADKFRIANQPDFPVADRLQYRRESDYALRTVARLIDAVTEYRAATDAMQEPGRQPREVFERADRAETELDQVLAIIKELP